MTRGSWAWVASIFALATASPGAAQDVSVRLQAHMDQEKKWISEANSASNAALDLRLKGRLADSIPLYLKAAKAYEAIVIPCGKVEGSLVLGCAYDESTLGSAVADLAGALHDLGKTEEGIRVFAATKERLEARWKGCGTAAWDFDCAEAAEKRRSFLTHEARFLENAGRLDGALALRRRMLGEHEALLAACAGDKCEAAADAALTAYATLRETLKRAERPADALALDEAWLPRLLAAPLFGAGKKPGAEGTAKSYAEALVSIVSEVAALGTPPAAALLARLGQSGAVTAAEAKADHAARLAELDRAYLAISLTSPGRRSEIRAEQARLIAQQSGPASREHGEALGRLGAELRLAERWSAAAEALQEALAIHRKNEPADDFRVLRAAGELATVLVRAGRAGAAMAVLGEVLAAPANDKTALYTDPARRWALAYGVGDSNALLNGLKAQQAELLLAERGDAKLAVQAARHAALGVSAYRSSLGAAVEDEDNRDRAERDPEWYTGEKRFGAFSLLYADTLWSAGHREAAVREEAFLALQEATAGITTSALARGAAERIASASGAGPLLARRWDLSRQIRQISLADTAGDQRALTDAFNKRARLIDERVQLDARIAAAAPDYFALISPQPLKMVEAQALLGPDEAALIAVPSRFGTHVLLVTREGGDWHRADLPEAKLNEHARRLLWDVGGNVEVTEEEEARWSAEGEGVLPFDRKTAHLLYRELVAPLSGKLAGKRHLFVIGGGALASLPFSMLVAEPPQGQDGDPKALRDTDWLADRFALVQLPSLQSLQLLRLVAKRGAAPAGRGLLGYGDPVLEGEAVTRGIADPRRRSGGAALPAAAALTGTGEGTALADVGRLRQLARLPGTAKELEAMRLAFAGGSASVRMAAEATETRLKADGLTGLSVLAFATHGLLAGEAQQVGGSEPGLVFTPPPIATPRDDGLLTASEIAALKISADWVVLSACNTAAGDGSSGAAGLSGLARSFFFAGARSLLASHWPVRDDVAAVLTVEVLRQQQAHPDWSRAEALRAAMKAIRDDPKADRENDTWAHPSAWAPFTFVGDWRR